MALAVIGNPRDGFSEGRAWRTVEDRASYLMFMLDEFHGQVPEDRRRDAVKWAKEILALAEQMRMQAQRGVHVNPRSSGRSCMSKNVQALIYVHADDDDFYVHAFGNGKVSDVDLRLLARMKCFKPRTSVAMYAESNGSVSLEGMRGQNLWKEF